LLDAVESTYSKFLDNFLNKNLRGRRPSRDANVKTSVEPFQPDVAGTFNEVSRCSITARHFNETVRSRTVRRPHDQDEIGLLGKRLYRRLTVLRGVTDVRTWR